jgi:adenosylcobinamide-phosphate synthase
MEIRRCNFMVLDLLWMNFLDILVAVFIDWIVGDPMWFPHPVVFMGKLISALEKLGRKICSTDKKIKYFGGVIVVILTSVSFLIPFLLMYIFRKNIIAFNLVNIVFMATALSAKSLNKESIKVYFSLKSCDIQDARKKLSYIVGRDTTNLDEKQIVRAAVETVAENTSDGVIAPLFYGIIFGAPLAMMYKAVNTMDSMLGYMNEKYRYIGFFPAKVDDVFNFIPARITGILISIVSPVVGGNIINSFKIMVRDRKNHKSPNCAYPEAAVSGALGVQLGGTNIYFGQPVYKPTIGDDNISLDFVHIKYAIKLMYLSEIIGVLIYSALIYVIINL